MEPPEVNQIRARRFYCLKSERTVSGSVLNSQQIKKKSRPGHLRRKRGSTTKCPAGLKTIQETCSSSRGVAAKVLTFNTPPPPHSGSNGSSTPRLIGRTIFGDRASPLGPVGQLSEETSGYSTPCFMPSSWTAISSLWRAESWAV